jgi:hypothetical protein
MRCRVKGHSLSGKVVSEQTHGLLDVVSQSVATLLESDRSPAEYREAAKVMADALWPHSGLPDYVPGNPFWQSQVLSTGLAMAPGFSFGCMRDGSWVSAFLRCVKQAIDERLAGGVAPVHILYPGCGSAASLVLPLLPMYSAEQVQVTLIDLWSGALDSVRNLCAALGVLDRVAAFVHADATVWASEPLFDVAVIGCVQQGLSREPQVALTRHAAGLLKVNGELLPERIELQLIRLKGADELGIVPGKPVVRVEQPDVSRREVLAVLGEVSLASVREGGARAPTGLYERRRVHVAKRVGDELVASYARVQVRAGLEVAPWSSGLATPRLLRVLFEEPDQEDVYVCYSEAPEPDVHVSNVMSAG